MRLCLQPIIFEPGSSWFYSAGIDWAGKLRERLTNATLEQHTDQYICAPLDIEKIIFWPGKDPGLNSRVHGMVTRTPEGELFPWTHPLSFSDEGSTDCFGDHGAYATLSDFLKVQRSILANDGKLLKPETVDTMFQPQLSTTGKNGLAGFRRTNPMAAMMAV